MKQPMIANTVTVMCAAHYGQVDMAGMPYQEHPERVLHRMLARWPDATVDEQHAALLHDVLADTSITEADLRRLGYSEVVVSTVVAVTRDRNWPYHAWVQVIADSGVVSAIRVKWAENRDNADPERLALLPKEVRIELAARYAAALVVLEAAL